MMAGGAFMALRLKLFPGLVMDMRSRLSCVLITAIMAAMTTGNSRSLLVILLRDPGRKTGTLKVLERD